ncbi:MAG TPA: hypothetical protein GX698_01235 [Acholeplasmataceae bacterium]|nr:hypothetical protein [Acholeplasmataceae bacterium]
MKKIISLSIVLLLSYILVACGNQDLGWGNYTYHYAYIEISDGTYVEIEIERWKDYDDGMVEIYTKDENNILTHSHNVIMSKDKITYLNIQQTP